MARALEQIISELDSVYRPQRDLYNQQLSQQDPQMEAEQKGLMAQKEDSFRQITDQANRRGMFYSGLPIAEEQRYTGQQFLPAMANLAGKYKASKDNLSETLNRLSMEQRDKGYGILQNELAIDEQMRREAEQRRQFDAQMAAQQAAEAASRGGRGGFTLGATDSPLTINTGQPTPRRQQWQLEANRGDWNAQVALNYLDDNGRYDGPVNSQDEYDRLKSLGAQGNFYVRGASQPGKSYNILTDQGGKNANKKITSQAKQWSSNAVNRVKSNARIFGF